MGSSPSLLPSSTQYTTCDSCKGDFQRAETFCQDCREFFCPSCSLRHQQHDHLQLALPPDENSTTIEVVKTCDPCKCPDGVAVCVLCRDLFCENCYNHHKSTKFKEVHHVIYLLNQSTWDIKTASSAPPPTPESSDVILGATYIKNVSSRIPGDRKNRLIEIQRIVTLPDDRVVVLDKENKKLKLFDADINFKHFSNMDGDPVGLTVVDDATVAVSDKQANCITLFTVHNNNTLHKYKSVMFDKECWGLYDISYQNQHFICLACNEDGHRSSIHLVNMKGHRTTVLEEDGNYDLGSHIVAGVGNCFFVSDYYKDQVRCITYNGEQLWTLATPTGPRGITLVRGKLCVVSVVEGMVLQASENGELSDQLLVQGLVHPRCVCFQKQRNMFLVAHDQADALIKIYKIK